MGNNLKFRPDGAAVGLLALLLAVVLAFSLLMPGRFFSGATFTSVAFQLPELGLLTLAMFIPILSGGLNLCIIASANLTSLLMAWLFISYLPADAGLGLQAPSAMAALRAERLIRSTGPALDDELETYHDRIRESVQQHVGARATPELHRRLALAFEQCRNADVEATAAAQPWRAAIEAERTVHTKSTITAFGFSGTLESWSQRPDKVASQTALGPFTLKDGFDGTTAWRIDQNGKLAFRDGKELEDEKGGAWYENGLWLAPDQGGGSITVQGQQKDSAGAYTVLEVKGPVGRTRSMWFDTKTGLVDRVAESHDEEIARLASVDASFVKQLTVHARGTSRSELAATPRNTHGNQMASMQSG